MTADTWKAFCKAVLSELAEPKVESKDLELRTQQTFRCDRCAMEFSTCIKLDGQRHLAIKNKCGGSWKLKELELQPVPAAVAGTSLPDEPGMDG